MVLCVCPCPNRSLLGGAIQYYHGISSVWGLHVSESNYFLPFLIEQSNKTSNKTSHSFHSVTCLAYTALMQHVFPCSYATVWKGWALHVVLSLPVYWKHREPSLCQVHIREAVLYKLCETDEHCCRFHLKICALVRLTLFLKKQEP